MSTVIGSKEYTEYLYEVRRRLDALDDALAVHGLPPINRDEDALMVIFKTLTHILNLIPERKPTEH